MSYRGAEEGVSLLEFALIVPILVFIVLGVADLSLVIAQSVIVTQAAEAGAAYGTLAGQSQRLRRDDRCRDQRCERAQWLQRNLGEQLVQLHFGWFGGRLFQLMRRLGFADHVCPGADQRHRAGAGKLSWWVSIEFFRARHFYLARSIKPADDRHIPIALSVSPEKSCP